MKVLVTGATGFTGGGLARRLRGEGHEVRALVRPGSNVDGLESNGIELFEGQLANEDDVLTAARDCDQIYHIAAVFRTAGHSTDYYRTINVKGTENVLAAARHHGCERTIHCSTGGVHSHIARPPADENYPFNPGDVYQRTKLEGELKAHEAIKAGQPISIFRPGSIYGPGDLRLLKLFKAIRSGRFRMIGSGVPRFHLAYLEDLIDGIVLMGQKQEALGEVFLLAGPEAPRLKDLVAMVGGAVGVKPRSGRIPLPPVYAAAAVCEALCVPLGIEPPLHRRRVGFFTHHREFDLSKAKRLLGYEPKVMPKDGIQATADWYVQQGLIDPPPNGVLAGVDAA